MFKLFEAVAEFFYWLGIFISPFLASLLVAYVLHYSLGWPSFISVLVLIAGTAAGILLAEYIRKKYGCSNFWARLGGTTDIPDRDDKSYRS
jgi:MFS family permease